MIQISSMIQFLAVLLTAIISVGGALIWLRIVAWQLKLETKQGKTTGLED